VSRNALPADVAEQLLVDSDATVRYHALRSLVAAGKQFSDDQAKAILVKTAPLAGLGFLSSPVPQKEGERRWKRFLKQRLRAASISALEGMAATESVFDRDARAALDYRRFAKRAYALRRMIDDRFQSEFADEITKLEKKVGVDADIVSKIKANEEPLRKEWLRQGLDVLCEKSSSQDLSRIRQALEDGFVDYSELDVNYLKRHGEWRDIKLLLSLAERPVSGLSLLAAYHNDDAMDAIAEATYSLGKGRFGELTAQPMSDGLLSRIIRRAPETDFAKLTDDQIVTLLSAESTQLRKLVAIKSIRSLNRSRLKRLFDSYMKRDRRYYNVIHWLDMGISVSKQSAIAAADRALSSLD
jgi:hypothetical protein